MFSYGETYSTKQVALLFGVHEETVRKWVKDGKIHKGHSASAQGAFIISGSSLHWFVRENPKYKLVDMNEHQRREYLLATKDKCMREITAAETIMHKNREELNEVINELFKN